MYEGHFDRVCFRKSRKTFNLTLHSWSLLKRSGEHFDHGAPDHEERLHRICEHLTKNTSPMGYTEWLAKTNDAPMLTRYTCISSIVEVPEQERMCTICGAVFGDKLPNDVCLGCGARARHRQLHDVFSRVGNPFIGCRVLAMYANNIEERVFFSQASELQNFDVRPAREADVRMDMQDIGLMRSESFDAFYAAHVLNHVVHDRKALSEIHRILKSAGVAVLTVPYREEPSTSSPGDLAEHYKSEALAMYGIKEYRRYELGDVLGLFGELFDVQAEEGFDPVTQERMKVFILRKGADTRITEMNSQRETHASK
jgi:SAM-dependent methyltransferase